MGPGYRLGDAEFPEDVGVVLGVALGLEKRRKGVAGGKCERGNNSTILVTLVRGWIMCI